MKNKRIQTAAMMILLAGAVTLLVLWVQPNSLREVVSVFLAEPLLIVLNALPVGLLMLSLSFLLGSVWYGAALAGLIACGLSLANRIKIEVRDEPVFPRDLALLREVGSAMRHYDIHIPAQVVAVCLLCLLLLLLPELLKRLRHVRREKLFGPWPVRLGGFLGGVVLLAGLIAGPLGSKTLYNDMMRVCSNQYRLSIVFNETGFPYGFCRLFTTYNVEKPGGYSREEAEDWDSASGSEEEGLPVNLIFVMNEAFSDITDQPVFQLQEDPLPNLHAMRQDPHALWGHVVVPGFAGGTANTEFDVVTGMQTVALSETTTSAMRVVNRNLDSIFRVCGSEGYATSFIHPGHRWFYNRENVYRWMGAESSWFVEDMPDAREKGGWITDDYTADCIFSTFEAAAASGKLLCNYTTTIQNHMAYTYDKYGADYAYPPVETSETLSPEVQEMLEVYVEGARDADRMLGRLRDYFRERSEPVVLVYYGDHLPYLGDGGLGYSALGLPVPSEGGETPKTFFPYETPYVIWANDAAAEVLDWDRAIAQLDLPRGGEVSACFLGAAVLELSGRGAETAWFSFLNGLRRQCPVVQRTCYQDVAGQIHPITDAEGTSLGEAISRWRKWSYYKLMHKQIP